MQKIQVMSFLLITFFGNTVNYEMIFNITCFDQCKDLMLNNTTLKEGVFMGIRKHEVNPYDIISFTIATNTANPFPGFSGSITIENTTYYYDKNTSFFNGSGNVVFRENVNYATVLNQTIQFIVPDFSFKNETKSDCKHLGKDFVFYINNQSCIKKMNSFHCFQEQEQDVELCFKPDKSFSKNPIEVFSNLKVQGDNFVFELSNNKTDINGKNGGLINATQCKIILKIEYNIPQEQDITFASLVSEDKFELFAYDSSGNVLSLTPCKDMSISAIFPYNETGENEEVDKYYKNEINLFDSTDEFFSNICVGSESSAPISTRQKNMYINITSFCDPVCKKVPVENTNTVKCQCPSDDFLFGSQRTYESFQNITSILNFDIIPCWSVLSFFALITNIGFWLIGICFLICFILAFFLPLGFNKLRGEIHQIVRVMFLSIKNKNTSTNTNLSNVLSNNRNPNTNIYNTISLVRNEETEFNSHQQVLFSIIIKYRTIDNYPFQVAFYRDKRTFWEMIKIYFIKKNSIAKIIYPSPYQIKIMNIILFIFKLVINFTVSCLCYNEDLLDKNWSSENIYFLFFTFSRSLISAIITGLIFAIAYFLTYNSSKIQTVIEELDYHHNVDEYILRCISSLKKKITLIFSFAGLLTIFCWYYCSIFCIIYHSFQISVLITFITGFTLSEGIMVGITIIISGLRRTSFIFKNHHLYNLSLLIDKNTL